MYKRYRVRLKARKRSDNMKATMNNLPTMKQILAANAVARSKSNGSLKQDLMLAQKKDLALANVPKNRVA